MKADRLRDARGRSQGLSGYHGIRTAPPVPKRHSSANFSHRTNLSGENASIVSAEDDAYLRALKQLSATHRPSLDNMFFDRSIATDVASSLLSNKIAQRNPPSARHGDHAREYSSQLWIPGQRYHTLPGGSDYTERVDGPSVSKTLDHSTADTARPATGVVSSQTRSDDMGHRRASRYAALNHMPTSRYPGETATSKVSSAVEGATVPSDSSDGLKQESRDGPRSKRLRWSIPRPKL